jgi:hypothetical protein
MDWCAICGTPLDLFELLNWSLDQIGSEHFCDDCREDEELMEEYIFNE